MKIFYIRSNFPKMSETFILQEIITLRSMGHDVRVLSHFCESHLIHPKVWSQEVFEWVSYHDVPVKVEPRFIKFFKHRAPSRKYWSAKNFFKNYLKKNCMIKRLVWFFLVSPFSKYSFFKTIALSFRMNNLSIALKYPVAPLEVKPDIIYCPFSTLYNLTYAASLSKYYGNVPYVTCFRANDLYSMYPVELEERKELVAGASLVFTISNYNKMEILRRFPFTKDIHIIRSNFDTDFFKRRGKKIGHPIPIILSVGRLIEKKGFEYLILACKILMEMGNQFICRIVGEGELKDSLNDQIIAHNLQEYVFLVGSLNHEQVRAELENADIFVLPCIIDQKGNRDILANAIKEAMAMELPVVTSNISGIEELIDDGSNGVLTEPKDIKGIAAEIDALLGNKEKMAALGGAARNKIEYEYSSKRQCEKIVFLFEHLLGR